MNLRDLTWVGVLQAVAFRETVTTASSQVRGTTRRSWCVGVRQLKVLDLMQMQQ
jgi:hypothetical protein